MTARPIIHLADTLDWMDSYDGKPFDAIVTDPPYGLSFMGSHWDNFGTPLGYQRWSQAWALAALTTVRPGAHMVAFGSPRLYHRMAVGIEDAGWEIRDSLMWLYGSGFPKSHNLKGNKSGQSERRCNCEEPQFDKMQDNVSYGKLPVCSRCEGSPRAKPTNGYGTGLKPAFEPIVIARKPLIGTVQKNFDTHGTGAMNIDAARIPLDGEAPTKTDGSPHSDNVTYGRYSGASTPGKSHDAGRWPPNVALDEEAAEMLDSQFQTDPDMHYPSKRGKGGISTSGMTGQADLEGRRGGTERSGVSRFFYTSKASRREREAGLSNDPVRRTDGRASEHHTGHLRTDARRNHHPAVKPIDLMRWLCRFAVPERGRVLDPFCGSGSTLIAAHAETMTAVGIEQEPEYVEIARARIDHWCAQARMM